MTINPTPSAPTQPLRAADRHAQDTQHYCGLLREMADRSADLARKLHQQAEPQAAALGAIDLTQITVDFDRITRCMRRCIALADRLGRARPVLDRVAARQQIIRKVEDRIAWSAREDEAEALEDELYERLDGPEFDDDIDSRPIAEIITEICQDLHLGAQPGRNPWKRRTPEDIAVLHARAAGSRDADEDPPDPTAERFFHLIATP